MFSLTLLDMVKVEHKVRMREAETYRLMRAPRTQPTPSILRGWRARFGRR
jgi:hypothetical protein